LFLIDFKIFVQLKYIFYFPSIFRMNDSKINKLLKALPSDVVKRFGKSLKEKTNGERLFKYLNNPKKDLNNIGKMGNYVFEKQRANPSKSLQNEGYILHEALKEWLIQQELEANKLTQNQLLSDALKRHKATDAYFEILNERQRLIEKQPARNSAYHWSQMRLSHARYFHPQTDFASAAAEDNFTKTVHHLDEFYLHTRLLYIAERNMRNSNHDLDIIVPRQSEMLRPNYKDKPLVQICMLAAKLIHSRDNELFRTTFCPLMEAHIHLADPENQGILATYRINYTSKQTQGGNADFMRDQFDAYKFAIENGYLESEGHLDETHFLNAVTAASVSHEFEAGKQLINEASVKLKDNVENICKLAQAYLYLNQSLYVKAHNELLQLSFTNIHTDLRFRSLKAQCMYELFLQNDKTVNANLLTDYLGAYQKFVERHAEISDTTRQSNLNFIQLLKKMVNHPDKSKTLLRDFLKTKKAVFSKKWLLDLAKK